MPARPRYGWGFEEFEQDADGVTAHVVVCGALQTLRVRYLIGTDGGRSVVRHCLGIEFPGETLGVRAIVADIALIGLDRSAWHRFGDSMRRMVAICPLMGTDLFQLQAPVSLEGDVDVSADALTMLIRERSGRLDITVDFVSWASVYSMNARLAACYRIDRVFLAGDAAHIHPPTGGQGLNTSVQDVYNLGWKLAAVLAGAPDALLDSYEQERRPVAAEVLGLSTRLLDETRRGIMRRGREVKQLDLGYPDTSVSFASSKTGACVIAGDRAPDAPMRGAAGQTRRLFDLFEGPHWTLLNYADNRLAIQPRPNLHIHTIGSQGELSDPDGHFRDAYRLSDGDCILVRPDGYIAAVASANDAEALGAHLHTLGLGLGA
jgi:hypothetical protein